MTTSFDASLTTAKDRIRQRIGDTAAPFQVQDETIAAYLTDGFTELKAAQRLCLDLAAKWATAATVTIDDQQQRAEGIYKHYIDLAAAIGAEAPPATTTSATSPGITVGGLNDRRGPLQDCPIYSYPPECC